ncbi:MAG TPA: alpha/beta hydrolase [Acidimicrobiales bacterium]
MWTERVALPSGVELALRRWPGDGRAFVLVHGLASNARLWDGVAEALSRAGRPVVAVDQRGHGLSDKPEIGYDMATVADDLALLVAALGLAGPVLAGQSWGGNVVLEAAFRHPGMVSAVALVDGGWLHLGDHFSAWEECAEALKPPALEGLPLSRLEAAIRIGHPDWPESGIQATLANFEVRADGTIRPWLTLEHHLAILRSLWEHEPRTRYPAIGVPVLLCPADPDHEAAARRFDQQALVDEAAAALPAARVRWFRPSDHDIHAQHPEALADALLELV